MEIFKIHPVVVKIAFNLTTLTMLDQRSAFCMDQLKSSLASGITSPMFTKKQALTFM
jgi:hypothetical protein